ncbi:hypothetical protein DFH09DRAFT_1355827 [Mycena vulgaris]|nr:hypothetical protein DFH09DRAFT_1355827 [Mycena vulgaris]
MSLLELPFPLIPLLGFPSQTDPRVFHLTSGAVWSLCQLTFQQISPSSCALLADSKDLVEDKTLRHVLEAGMVPDLAHLYAKSQAKKIEELDDWLAAVADLDEDRVYENEKFARVLEAIKASSVKRKCSEDGEHAGSSKKLQTDAVHKSNPASNKLSSAASASSSFSKSCPALLPAERDLLAANDGCNRCRRFFVGHRTVNCDGEFPTAENYHTLTQADVNAAAKKGKSKAVAAVMPAIEDDEDSLDSEEDLSRSVSSSSSSDRVDHLYWECLIEGPMSNLPLLIKALIDNGAHLALIDHL